MCTFCFLSFVSYLEFLNSISIFSELWVSRSIWWSQRWATAHVSSGRAWAYVEERANIGGQTCEWCRLNHFVLNNNSTGRSWSNFIDLVGWNANARVVFFLHRNDPPSPIKLLTQYLICVNESLQFLGQIIKWSSLYFIQERIILVFVFVLVCALLLACGILFTFVVVILFVIVFCIYLKSPFFGWVAFILFCLVIKP